MNDEQLERKYRAYVRAVNREPPDDEYSALAACDSLNAAYNLEAYQAPRIPKRRPRADLAVERGGGVFAFSEGKSPCRE